MKQSGKPADKVGMVDNASSTPKKAFDSVENHPAAQSLKKKGKKQELTLAAQNESASKKKRPFEYNERETSQNKDG